MNKPSANLPFTQTMSKREFLVAMLLPEIARDHDRWTVTGGEPPDFGVEHQVAAVAVVIADAAIRLLDKTRPDDHPLQPEEQDGEA